VPHTYCRKSCQPFTSGADFWTFSQNCRLFSCYADLQCCFIVVMFENFCGLLFRNARPQIKSTTKLRAGDGRADQGWCRRVPRHHHAATVRRPIQRTSAAACQPASHDRRPTSSSATGATRCSDTHTETSEQVQMTCWRIAKGGRGCMFPRRSWKLAFISGFFWGLRPQTLSRLYPWTSLEDFRPQTPSFVPHSKFLATLLYVVLHSWIISSLLGCLSDFSCSSVSALQFVNFLFGSSVR